MKEIDQHAKFQRSWLRDRLMHLAEGVVLVLVGVGLLAGGVWIGLTMDGHRYTDGKPWIAWSIGGLMGVGGCIFGMIGRRHVNKEARLAASRASLESPLTNYCSDVFREFNLAIPWPENRSFVSFHNARFLLNTGEHQEAREIFGAIDSEMPGNAVIGFCIARCDRMLGRFAEALHRLEEIMAAHDWTDPARAFLEFECAEAFLEAGEISESMRKLNRLAGLDFERTTESLLLDWLASRMIVSPSLDRGATGLEIARRAHELDPSSVSRGLTLAWFLLDSSQDEKAEELARAALQKSDSATDQALGAFVIAKIQWKRGHIKEAERLAAFARYAMPEGSLRQTVGQPLANP